MAFFISLRNRSSKATGRVDGTLAKEQQGKAQVDRSFCDCRHLINLIGSHQIFVRLVKFEQGGLDLRVVFGEDSREAANVRRKRAIERRDKVDEVDESLES